MRLFTLARAGTVLLMLEQWPAQEERGKSGPRCLHAAAQCCGGTHQ